MGRKKIVIENITLERLNEKSKIECDCGQKATIELFFESRGKQKHCCSDLPCFIKAIVILMEGDCTDREVTYAEIPNYLKGLPLRMLIL